MMRYKEGVKLNKDGKALVCPRCKNDDIKPGDRCKICGAYLIQKCAGEKHPVHEPCEVNVNSNARYCTKCGGRTTFFKFGYLDDWKTEKALTNNNVITKEVVKIVLEMLEKSI